MANIIKQQDFSIRTSRVKFFLSAGILLLVLLIMLLIRNKPPASDLPTIDLADLIIDGGGVIYKPHSKGKNSKGTPYEISADTARSDSQNKNIVHLTQIHVVLDMTAPQKGSELTAQAGIFQRYDDILTLIDGIHIRSGNGYNIQTPRLKIDFKNDIARTDTIITGQGPMGEITAGGMTASYENGHIYFHKPVKVVIYRQETKGVER